MGFDCAVILENAGDLKQILIKMEQSSLAALLRGVCNFVGDVLMPAWKGSTWRVPEQRKTAMHRKFQPR